ncbi:MAG: exodeoxyribonuclease VII large subunit, partial [Alphaproteobacteria bacterium]|nr:exodeoxyribonuclease VII large subunit [Alphaproteobacteria bacterium]
FDILEQRLSQALLTNTHALKTRAMRASSRLNPANLRQRITHEHQRTQTTFARLNRALHTSIVAHRATLDSQSKLLNSLGYRNVLSRGYAIVRNGKGQMIRQASAVSANEVMDIEFADGHIPATASARAHGNTPSSQSPSAGTRTKSGKPRGKATGSSGQGSLF